MTRQELIDRTGWNAAPADLDNARGMIRAHGRLVATGACGVEWHVVDGDLWCVKSLTQLHYAGRYPDDLPKHVTRQ